MESHVQGTRVQNCRMSQVKKGSAMLHRRILTAHVAKEEVKRSLRDPRAANAQSTVRMVRKTAFVTRDGNTNLKHLRAKFVQKLLCPFRSLY